MSKIIVIGGNAAGMSFAAKYHRNSPSDQILVLEKLSKVSFGACGLPYFAQGFFEDENDMYARTVDDILKSGIDLKVNATVVDTNFVTKEVKYIYNDKECIEKYDKLIIATGASPIMLEGVSRSSGIQNLTTIEDGKLLKSKLLDNTVKDIVIIGSGFIGMEVLDAAVHHNKKVIMIESADGLLSKYVEKEFQEMLQNYLEERGVEVKLGQKVKHITDSLVVKTEMEEIKGDHIIVSIGFRPNTKIFKDIDKLSNGAIITNEDNQTSVEGVYAIGDCSTVIDSVTKKPKYIALATVANKQGRSLADKIAGIDNKLKSMIGSSAVKILDLDIARCGITVQECIENKINYDYKIITDKTHTSYYPNQENISICLIYEKDSLKIIGAQLIGKKDVVHRANTIALAIQQELTTKELGYVDFAYAPPFSRTWEVLNVVGNVIKK